MRKPNPSRQLSLLVGLILIAVGLCVSWVGSITDTRVMAVPPDGKIMTLYDPDPKHLWNRLHQALHIRLRDGDATDLPVSADQVRPERLDPFFWDRHHPYLLSGPGHREALTLLDEFLDKKGEGLVKEPLKRALLQRDLWALFDWAADANWPKREEKKRFVKERGELQSRLGRVISRLALSAKEIEQLPDNYAAAVKAKRYPAEFQADRKSAAFLPADLRDPKGPWVLLGSSGGGPLAGQHVQFFGGRSTFMIFLRLPEGRDQTLKYVDQLSEWLKKGAKGGPATVPHFSANTHSPWCGGHCSSTIGARSGPRRSPSKSNCRSCTIQPQLPMGSPASKPSSNSASVASSSLRARRADWVLFLTTNESGNTLPSMEAAHSPTDSRPFCRSWLRAAVVIVMARGFCRSTVSRATTTTGTSRRPGTRSAGFPRGKGSRIRGSCCKKSRNRSQADDRRRCRRRTRRCSRRPPPCWFLGVHSSLGRRPLLSLCVRRRRATDGQTEPSR